MDSPACSCTQNIPWLATMASINKHVTCSSFHVVYYHICCRHCLAGDSIFCQPSYSGGISISFKALSCKEKTVVKKCRTIIGESCFVLDRVISDKLPAYKWFYSRTIPWEKLSCEFHFSLTWVRDRSYPTQS